MSQNYRISKFDEIEQILARVRDAHEAEETAQLPVEDRVEKNRTAYLPDGPAHRVDLHRAITNNLERGPFNPERLGQSRNGSGRIVVKAEARSNDFFGAQPQAEQEIPQDGLPHSGVQGQATPSPSHAEAQHAELPGWVASEQALESAVDFNEEVLVPNAKNQPTTGAVASMAQRPEPKPEPKPQPGRARVSGPATRPPERPERTSPGFAYPEGGAYMQQYAPGFVAESGEGKSYVDPNRTQTHIVHPDASGKLGAKK